MCQWIRFYNSQTGDELHRIPAKNTFLWEMLGIIEQLANEKRVNKDLIKFEGI